MDSTKYQVFISSTFKDLEDERKKVLDTLLMADCIPAGMENFVATDDEQFSVIKRVIDLCDYYILILGKRYGSVNSTTGKSYTEMEYEYAIEKGIPVLVFVIDDNAVIDSSKTETDEIKRGKLAEFKLKAMDNRLASVWKDPADLVQKVLLSIMKAKIDIKRPGWHRGGDEIIESLTKENLQLKAEIEKYKMRADVIEHKDEDLQANFYEKIVTLNFTEKIYIFTSDTVVGHRERPIALSEVFRFISVRLTGVHTQKDFINAVSALCPGYTVDTQDALIVRNLLEQLGLFETEIDKKNQENIKLTEKGKKIRDSLVS